MSAWKRLAAVAPSATTNTKLYEPAASSHGPVNVSVCNRGASPALLRLAHIDSASIGDLANEDYLLFDVELAANGSETFSGITIAAGESLMCRASTADTSWVVHGHEEDQ